MRAMPPQDFAPSYRHVAWAYDLLASAYSLGAIDRAKRLHQHIINPGDHVLYAGAGRGREIVGASQRGGKVTCVEPCPAMALRLHDRLATHSEGFTILPQPIQSITPVLAFDVVVAHFFLNVFDVQSMPAVLNHLGRFVKPGGHLVIADFMPNPEQSLLLTRLLRGVYYKPLNLAGWLLRICARHPIYDYEPMVIAQGFEVSKREAFGVLPGLPPFYETIIAQRKKEPPSCDEG